MSSSRNCLMPSSRCSEADVSLCFIPQPMTKSIVKSATSPNNIDKAIQQLSTGEKYTLLKHQRKPSYIYAFPTTYLEGFSSKLKIVIITLIKAVGMNIPLLSQLAVKTHQIQSRSSCFLQNFLRGEGNAPILASKRTALFPIQPMGQHTTKP